MAGAGTRGSGEGAVGVRRDEDDREGLYLGDAINFLLSARRSGRAVDDYYREKLEFFQRWLALGLGGEDEVNAP